MFRAMEQEPRRREAGIVTHDSLSQDGPLRDRTRWTAAPATDQRGVTPVTPVTRHVTIRAAPHIYTEANRVTNRCTSRDGLCAFAWHCHTLHRNPDPKWTQAIVQ